VLPLPLLLLLLPLLLLLQVNAEGVFRYASVPWFAQALRVLALSGVHGVAVDVWVSATGCGRGGWCVHLLVVLCFTARSQPAQQQQEQQQRQ
jgi:hypothetical protein